MFSLSMLIVFQCFFNQMNKYSIKVCSFVSVICATSPAPVPIHFPGNLPRSLHLKYSFSFSVSISNSHRCVCLFPLSTSLVQRYILCLSFFLSAPFVSVTLSRSLMRFHSLSLLCQPPLAKRANVYFKRCAMHQPPPHRHSAEEKTGTTQAC